MEGLYYALGAVVLSLLFSIVLAGMVWFFINSLGASIFTLLTFVVPLMVYRVIYRCSIVNICGKWIYPIKITIIGEVKSMNI